MKKEKSENKAINEQLEDDTPTQTLETPKQTCEREHSGEQGACSDDGTWVPRT